MKELGKISSGLCYPALSLVYMQLFSVEAERGSDFGLFFEEDPNPIDRQIFEIVDAQHPPVKRYKFMGFDFRIRLDEPYEVNVSGHMHLEMSVFFDRTVALTYRMVVDGEACTADRPLVTDHVIALASLNMGAEHWGGRDAETPTNINLDIEELHIGNLHVGAEGEWLENPVSLCVSEGTNTFREVCARYKKLIHRCCRLKLPKRTTREEALRRLRSDRGTVPCGMKVRDLNYVYVDIWENVMHSDELFSFLKEEEIISHIFREHRRELIGLMSLYPAEWPYRTLESFDDVCGDNVAIDTDDLILLNHNICVVFGTYGLRGKGSPTDWKKHLEERNRYHVSWPEYMLILEMVLAKKYTVAYAAGQVLDCTVLRSSNPNDLLGKNAYLSLKITGLMLRLDAVQYSKFMSHKIMFDRTIARLDVERDIARLEGMMKNVDKSLHNLSEYRGLKQGGKLNIILAGISIASLFQILFMDVRLPYLAGRVLDGRAEYAAWGVIWLTTFVICTGLLYLLSSPLRSLRVKRKLFRKNGKRNH